MSRLAWLIWPLPASERVSRSLRDWCEAVRRKVGAGIDKGVGTHIHMDANTSASQIDTIGCDRAEVCALVALGAYRLHSVE